MRLPARYSPVGSFTADGRSFSVDGFHKKGIWKVVMDQPRTIFISNESKKAPVHRGFLGVGIVPTGELEGRQDLRRALCR